MASVKPRRSWPDAWVRRRLAILRWLTQGTWEFGRGIDIDMDGDVDGTGWMVRIELPRWLSAWARRHLPPPTKEEMFFVRSDISDVLLASLLISPVQTRAIAGYAPGVTPELEWAEDQLKK